MVPNYKSCPLKKRPIIYVKEEPKINDHYVQKMAVVKSTYNIDIDEQPQDLSLKRKGGFEANVVPAKREYILNLSNKSLSTSCPDMPANDLSDSSVMLSPNDELNTSMEYQPTNIHLRGLITGTSGYTTHPFRSAFVKAAGCKTMAAVWNTYQTNAAAIFPSPASSIVSTAASPSSAYSCQHITPPSSPGSEVNSEPEDLSVRNDIPLPALFHMFDEVPKQKSSNYSAFSIYPHCGMHSSLCSSPGISKHTDANNNNNKSYRFKCEKCKKMYSTSIGLSKHEQFHCPATEHNQGKKQHSCQDCGKVYTTIGALKMHIRTHTLPCKCPICNKAFSRPWLLQGHIRTHTGEKPFQCPDCPRSFADRSNLRAHQQTHVEVKKYGCKVCHKSFSRMSLLNKHASSYCTITLA